MTTAEKGHQIGFLLGMTIPQMKEAVELHQAISTSPHWNTARSNNALMVDCLYETANRHGMKLSQNEVVRITREVYGKGTQPKPHIWRESIEHIIRIA